MNPFLNRPRKTNSGKAVTGRCDACGKKFSLEAVKYKERPHDKAPGIQVKYWCCPYCGHKYDYMATDAEQRHRIGELVLLRSKQGGYRGMKNQALYKHTAKKIIALEAEIEARGAELKAEYIMGAAASG